MPATTTKWLMRRYANVKSGSEDRLYGTFAVVIPKNGGDFIATASPETLQKDSSSCRKYYTVKKTIPVTRNGL